MPAVCFCVFPNLELAVASRFVNSYSYSFPHSLLTVAVILSLVIVNVYPALIYLISTCNISINTNMNINMNTNMNININMSILLAT